MRIALAILFYVIAGVFTLIALDIGGAGYYVLSMLFVLAGTIAGVAARDQLNAKKSGRAPAPKQSEINLD